MFSSGAANEFVTSGTRMSAGEQIAVSSYRGSSCRRARKKGTATVWELTALYRLGGDGFCPCH